MSFDSRKPPPLLFPGSGGFSLAVEEIFYDAGDPSRQTAGFSRNFDPKKRGERPAEYPSYTLEELKPFTQTHEAISVLGGCVARRRFIEQAFEPGFRFAKLLHPKTPVSPRATVGEGTLRGFGGRIGPPCRTGRHCTFNSRPLMGESGGVGDYSYIWPGVQIAGSVTIGTGVLIGIQATLADHITIGDGAIVGAGAVVIRDVPDGAVVVGNPAREIKRRRPPLREAKPGNAA